jgi:orotidine-5'-phosphate decarboxylase
MTNFVHKLAATVEKNDSLVCVGLDPVLSRLPAGLGRNAAGVIEFNQRLIEATSDLVSVYKPNYAFYGALGADAWDTLAKTLEAIPDDIPVLLDAKVGDIGSTAEQWAHMIFDKIGADAVTVNPYMGKDALDPFLSYADRGVFFVCHTSNPGAADFERLDTPEGPVYEHVARKAVEWNDHGNCGLVVGATQADSMIRMRSLAPDLPFLVPGVGSQGGDLEHAVGDGLRDDGQGVYVNSSRSIIFASAGGDYPEAARAATQQLRQQINDVRISRLRTSSLRTSSRGVAQSG